MKIKEIIKIMFGSNRLYHFLLMILPSFICSLICQNILCGILVSLGVASALEFKDVLWTSKCKFSIKNIKLLNWKNFDLLDFCMTLLGGCVAATISFIFI